MPVLFPHILAVRKEVQNLWRIHVTQYFLLWNHFTTVTPFMLFPARNIFLLKGCLFFSLIKFLCVFKYISSWFWCVSALTLFSIFNWDWLFVCFIRLRITISRERQRSLKWRTWNPGWLGHPILMETWEAVMKKAVSNHLKWSAEIGYLLITWMGYGGGRRLWIMSYFSREMEDYRNLGYVGPHILMKTWKQL